MPDQISRREFIKSVVGTASALSAPTIINYLGQSSPSSDKEFLEISDGKIYMGGENYTIKGTNYMPRDHPWEIFEDFDTEQIDKELDMVKELGINSVRVPVCYQFSVNNVKWEKPVTHNELDEDYLENIDQFLDIADGKGIKAMPILFDKVYWTLFKSGYRKYAKEYLDQLITPFLDDERIMAWDIKNEPNSYMKKKSENRMWDFLQEMNNKIKSIDQNHPTTIGFSQDPEKVIRASELVDFNSYHHFDFPKKLKPIIDMVRQESDNPFVLQEFGIPTLEKDSKWPHSESEQEGYYNKTYKIAEQEGIGGTMFWTLLDFPEELRREDDHPLLPERCKIHLKMTHDSGPK